ncbi:MAG: hypothetical protein AB4368_28150 [Xenococcaceae cyanobacterium]
MEIRELVFLDRIVEKLDRKHRVKPQAVEEIFFQSPKIRFVEKGYRKDENVYAALSQTYAGRYLIVCRKKSDRLS